MINAKKELIEDIKWFKETFNEDISCAIIYFDNKKIELKEGYTQEEFDLFLSNMDFEYKNDSRHDTQFLDGYIWMTNGDWADRVDRGEYDYSERWRFNQYPEPPANLRKNESIKYLNL